jgi:hypothetical protein
MKKQLSLAGGLLFAATTIAFAVTLLMRDIPQNIASWTTWTVLDILVVASTVAAGNKRPWLQICMTVADSLIVFIIIKKGIWHWDAVETISTCGATLALYFWWKFGPKSAVVATTIAVVIAGIPTVHDAWLKPALASWWMWAGTSVACLLSTVGAKAWTIEDRLFPIVCLIFNLIMFILVIR